LRVQRGILFPVPARHLADAVADSSDSDSSTNPSDSYSSTNTNPSDSYPSADTRDSYSSTNSSTNPSTHPRDSYSSTDSNNHPRTGVGLRYLDHRLLGLLQAKLLLA